MYIKADNDGNILSISGEVIPDGIEFKPEMLEKPGFNKRDFYFDFVEQKIKEKTINMKLLDLKDKMKRILLEKCQKDVDFIFEKPEIKSKYKKIYDNIENATTINELENIEV